MKPTKRLLTVLTQLVLFGTVIVIIAVLFLTVRSFSGRNRKLKNPRFCLENKAFMNMPPEAAWYAT